jgi:vitamin K-dependent gamma-carboxylase
MPTVTAAPDTLAAVASSAGAIATEPTSGWERCRRAVSRPVPSGSYTFFRVTFGLLVVFSAARFIARGWVESLHLAPANHLTYPWFGWVRPFPTVGMYALFVAIGVLGIAIASGYRTRAMAAVFTVAFVYTELIDAALYLNHYWYVTLVGVLLAILPTTSAGPGYVPVVVVWALRAQVAVVYVFAGIAKLNADWLRGQPMEIWLAARTHLPVIGPILDESWAAIAMSWGGAVFDLTIVGWLVWRRSRPLAYVAVVVFHVSTVLLFPQIGVFAWVMILATPIFFDPGWTRRVYDQPRSSGVCPHANRPHANTIATSTLVVLLALAAVQVVLPLRHYLRDGNVRWNDDGYYLSWRVMLTERTGFLEFDVVDPATGQRWQVEPTSVLTEWQAVQAESRPDLALATAHLIADDFAERGHPDVEVYADSFVAFNGRLRQRQIDPTVDLAAVARTTGSSAYVLPLDPAVRD